MQGTITVRHNVNKLQRKNIILVRVTGFALNFVFQGVGQITEQQWVEIECPQTAINKLRVNIRQYG